MTPGPEARPVELATVLSRLIQGGTASFSSQRGDLHDQKVAGSSPEQDGSRDALDVRFTVVSRPSL
jgi:hypothetical protein